MDIHKFDYVRAQRHILSCRTRIRASFLSFRHIASTDGQAVDFLGGVAGSGMSVSVMYFGTLNAGFE
jgi:hypothetical protein